MLGLPAADNMLTFDEAVMDKVHAEDLIQVQCAIRGLLDGSRDSSHLIVRMRTSGAEMIWAEMRAMVAERSAEGRPARIIGSQKDITVERQNQIELATAQTRLQAAMSSMSEALCIVDESGRPSHVNEAFAKTMRFASLEDAIRSLSDYEALFEITRFNDHVKIGWPVRGALYGHATHGLECIVTRRDTNDSWCLAFSCAPIYEKHQSTVAGAVMTAHDITERKRSEERIRASEVRQAFLLRLHDQTRSLSDPDQIRSVTVEMLANHVGADRVGYAEDVGDGVHVDVTRAFTRGLPSLEGRYRYDDYGPQLMRALLAGETVVRADIQAMPDLTAEEKRAHAELGLGSTVNVPLVKDARLSAILFVHSVRARSWTDEEVLLFEEVVRRVWADVHRSRAERIVAEQASKLRLAMMAAEEASRAKTAFLANMSHEIRTPLNAIMGYSHMLANGARAEDAASCLQGIDQATEHLLSVINDVLDISAVEAGRIALKPSRFRVTDLLDSAISMIRHQASAKGLQLEVSMDRMDLHVVADQSRLRQVLVNLLSNAVGFTAAGSINLSCAVETVAGDSLMLRFAVVDTGIGISDADIKRLFVPFGQLDVSSTREYDGTGLGLTICRRLVELMEGHIGVSSTVGVGSVFHFTARVRADEVLQGADTDSVPDLPAEDQRLRQEYAGSRILLVEDNRANRVLAHRMLAGAGMVVDEAVNGEQAVQQARGRQYDVIIMDLSMPVMDGIQATRSIRALPGTDAVPIIALTGNAFDSNRKACLEAGMNDFLTKPLRWADMWPVLLHWLDRHKGVTSAP